jgi:hypothetical protein
MPLGRFVLVVLAWLSAPFALWYFAAPIILWPATLLAEVIARTGFGDLVRTVEQTGATLVFVTTLKPGQAIAGGVVSVEANTLLFSFGLPMFAALTLAAREPHWLRALAIGYAALIPAITWGIVADFLKNIAITASPQVASQTGFSALQREVIVFAYQFGSLILPAVAPAIAWVLTHRAFLERVRGAQA